MGEVDRSFAGSIPDLYDTYLVPLIFESYASDLARRAVETEPTRVLEMAAGTGVVTRALAPLLGKRAHYVVTDLNRPMLDRAASRQGPDGRIAWRQADALNLPFKDASFDTVVCQFGAMFFPDRVAGYREARRVLKRDGRFLFNVWDRIEENEFAHVVTQAVGAMFPSDPPRFLARTPHGYHDLKQIEVELRSAGFSAIEAVTLQERSEAPSSPPSSDRVLPGHAATRRDRTSGPCWFGGGDRRRRRGDRGGVRKGGGLRKDTSARDYSASRALCDPRLPGASASLTTRPSFMMIRKFFSGSAMSLRFSSGSPSTTMRSASAPASITPSLPG